MKRLTSIRTLFAVAVLLTAFLTPSQAAAQEPPLNLRLIRNFGFGGFGQIEGNFTLRITNPENLVRAEFYIDDQLVNTAENGPFEYRFHTSEFPPGHHSLAAIGYTASGEALLSNTIGREFLTAEQARAVTGRLVIPLLGLVVVLGLASAVIPVLLGRGKAPTPGVYGTAGGAICPRCGLPYTRHLLSPNLVTGKLERCPHCGKWAVVPRASSNALAAAETRLTGESGEGPGELEPEEARLRRMLEDSRYED